MTVSRLDCVLVCVLVWVSVVALRLGRLPVVRRGVGMMIRSALRRGAGMMNRRTCHGQGQAHRLDRQQQH